MPSAVRFRRSDATKKNDISLEISTAKLAFPSKHITNTSRELQTKRHGYTVGNIR